MPPPVITLFDTCIRLFITSNFEDTFEPPTIDRVGVSSLGEEDDRSLVSLLTEQIEFADVVILNKISDAGPERTEAARKIIRSLNADAKIIETAQTAVASDAILDTGLFDFETAHEQPMWAKELYGFANHVPEDEEYVQK